jgi:hypothetical protein
MSEDIRNVVDVVTALATLIVALAALFIARRQTEQAKVQAEIALTLANLELHRETPVLLPNIPEYSDGFLTWELANVGGGSAVDVFLDGCVLLLNTGPGGLGAQLQVCVLGYRIAYVRDREMVPTQVEIPEGFNVEKIVALKGHFTSVRTGEIIVLEYEFSDPGFTKGGFLRLIDSSEQSVEAL